MITERELRRVAGRAGLGVGQTEYEYVILCALDALSRALPLSDTFCLKGVLRYANSISLTGVTLWTSISACCGRFRRKV